MPNGPATDTRAHHARQLREADEKVKASVAMLEVRVIRARAEGMPWQLIGDALGVSRQAVTERFGALVEAENGN